MEAVAGALTIVQLQPRFLVVHARTMPSPTGRYNFQNA